MEAKKCQNCKQEFTIEPDDFAFYEKIKVPAPTFCPECRLQRRMAFRNERTIYKDICDLCGKTFISVYSPDKPFIVYCRECWYGDGWNPLSYSRDYDFEKPFFKQFFELQRAVPRLGMLQYYTNINADYANFVASVKNVYLAQSIVKSEDIYFSRSVDKSKNCLDCFSIKESELCYENVDGARNYELNFI